MGSKLVTTVANSVHHVTDGSVTEMLIQILHDNSTEMRGCPVMLPVHLTACS
jgi:hypothetical protein